MRLDTPTCDFGWQAPDFTLRDPMGNSVTLSDHPGGKGLLVMFLCNHCPYVLTIADFRIYISGDTEDTPEMRALSDIDLCFLCMSLPFTMDINAAASAVADFKPSYVYPYHYRGRDDGTQDPAAFAALVGDTAEVKFGDWYG